MKWIILLFVFTSCGQDPCEGHFEEIYYPERVIYIPDAGGTMTGLYTEENYQEEWVCDDDSI